MSIKLTKDFVSTSESKIYVEYNEISLEEQEKREGGLLFIPPNPKWVGVENNIIMKDIFYRFEKDYGVLKCIFEDYKTQLYNNKNDLPNIQYVRDASVVIDYFFSKFSCIKKFTVIGYSWGCSVVLNLIMRRPEISNFILISPTLTLKNCDWTTHITTFRTKGMIIHGMEDQLTKTDTIEKYIKFLESKKMIINLQLIEGADHYYENFQDQLYKKIQGFLQNSSNYYV